MVALRAASRTESCQALNSCRTSVGSDSARALAVRSCSRCRSMPSRRSAAAAAAAASSTPRVSKMSTSSDSDRIPQYGIGDCAGFRPAASMRWRVAVGSWRPSRPLLEVVTRCLPCSRAAVEHPDVLMSPRAQHPPEPGGPRTAILVVCDHGRVRADADNRCGRCDLCSCRWG